MFALWECPSGSQYIQKPTTKMTQKTNSSAHLSSLIALMIQENVSKTNVRFASLLYVSVCLLCYNLRTNLSPASRNELNLMKPSCRMLSIAKTIHKWNKLYMFLYNSKMQQVFFQDLGWSNYNKVYIKTIEVHDMSSFSYVCVFLALCID